MPLYELSIFAIDAAAYQAEFGTSHETMVPLFDEPPRVFPGAGGLGLYARLRPPWDGTYDGFTRHRLELLSDTNQLRGHIDVAIPLPGTDTTTRPSWVGKLLWAPGEFSIESISSKEGFKPYP